MTKKEFYEEAVLRVAAALVKVLDETSEGIIDNPEARTKLADTAREVAHELTAACYGAERPEPKVEPGDKMEWHSMEEGTPQQRSMYLIAENRNGTPFCRIAQYDPRRDLWRPWESPFRGAMSPTYLGEPLSDVQLSYVTHWMRVIAPETLQLADED